jgi:hypothetical protein
MFVSYQEPSGSQFYSRKDFVLLEEYYAKYHKEGDKYTPALLRAPGNVFPFSLELVIAYLFKSWQDHGFRVVIFLDEYDCDCFLSYKFSSSLLISIPKLRIKVTVDYGTVKLSKERNTAFSAPLKKGYVNAHPELLDIEGTPITFEYLSQYFDPSLGIDKDILTKEESIKELKDTALEVFPEFAVDKVVWRDTTIRDYHGREKQIKSGDIEKITVVITDDRANWDDNSIANLFLNNSENGNN